MKQLHLNYSATRLIQHKLTALLSAILVTACATTPAQKFNKHAVSAGLGESIINTKKFSLTTYSQSTLLALKSAAIVNIYLGGDGTPWITINHKSIDPTPRKHIALDLMLLDQSPSIYVGRPCYHSTIKKPDCNPKWWTSHRYSEDVISALLEAINSITTPSQKLNIIGFSGGGSLAMLLAAKLRDSYGNTSVNSVVTINANLDIQHWTERHNYSPLYGSLNPIRQTPLDSNIKQFHLFGKLDKNVDAAHLANILRGRQSTTVNIFPNFSHHCCWPQIWPTFIMTLE